jgi:two-component system sensor histidine kinase DesK
MDNDRVRTAGDAAGGTGLLGLSERLARLGGSITAQRPRSGHFRLEATLPASGAPAIPPDPGQRGSGASTAGPGP